jgi:HEAT repeat protein
MIPPNMKQKTVRGRIMLTHEETVKTGTSITTSFQYRLTGAQIEYENISDEQVAKIVRNAVRTISTCADGDPKIKSVLETLKPIDPQLVLKYINKHLNSKSATKRRSAIYIVWKVNFKDISIVEQKLIELCSHEENFTRGMAALALGERGATSSFDVLADMTLNDKDGFARRCGAYALGLIGDEKALPILEKALNDSDPLVKNNAEAAITMLKDLNEK